MLYIQNTVYNDMLHGLLGLYMICLQCLQYLICDHKKQRILDCNNIAILYAIDILDNNGRLFGLSDSMKQPIMWKNLVGVAIKTIQQIRLDNQMKQQRSLNNGYKNR